MCLPCIDPLIDTLKELNPFKRKRTGKVAARKENVDRDNINVPFLLEEKRSVVVSDPELKHPFGPFKVQEEKVMTMKKVSSLALV